VDKTAPIPSLEEQFGYQFQNPLLLAEALTHPSLAYETHRAHFDNQRLEFLGDAVLQLIFTHELFRTFMDYSEGNLTKLRARLVSRTALAAYARARGIGEHLLMGRGEEASGGRTRSSTLSDAFEALIGAIYLDGGLEAARSVVLRLCADDLARICDEPREVNPKGQLQEMLQALSASSPHYTIISEEGPDHRKTFVARVDWNGCTLGTGSGPSKKQAETAAAAAALISAEVKALARDRIENPHPASPPGNKAVNTRRSSQ
jgi:ribonuclease III